MVPALIIVGMLLLAVLITCMLSKKRKAGKLGMFWKETLSPCIPVSRQKYAVVQEQVGESKNIKRVIIRTGKSFSALEINVFSRYRPSTL